MSKATQGQSVILILFSICITLLPGPLLLFLYKKAISQEWIEPLLLFQNKKDVATMISSFSYTMLGFLVAMITVLLAFTHTEAYKKYSRLGYLNVFILIYCICVASLIATSILSIFGYSGQNFPTVFNWMMAMFVNDLVQILIISLIIGNVVRRAQSETHSP